MAAPIVRRSGHSKKAQLSAFTGYILAGAGVLLGAALLLLSFWHPDVLSGLRSEATDIAAPAGRVSAEGRNQGQGLFATVSGYFQSGSKNARLQAEVKEAQVRLVETDALKAENERLKALLGLREEEVKPVAFAKLIGSTSSSTRRMAYLSAGKVEGVSAGMPVRSPLGLVGRVLEVGDHSARVLLLTDGKSMVPVRRVKDNVIAFAEGRADGSLNLRLINLGISRLWRLVEQGGGRHDLPGLAIAALGHVQLVPCVADLLADGRCGNLLDRGDLLACRAAHGRSAGAHGLTIHHHSASAAQRHAATEFRAEQA